jgi:hypothetical protein
VGPLTSLPAPQHPHCVHAAGHASWSIHWGIITHAPQSPQSPKMQSRTLDKQYYLEQNFNNVVRGHWLWIDVHDATIMHTWAQPTWGLGYSAPLELSPPACLPPPPQRQLPWPSSPFSLLAACDLALHLQLHPADEHTSQPMMSSHQDVAPHCHPTAKEAFSGYHQTCLGI